jgi:hypothetical protein
MCMFQNYYLDIRGKVTEGWKKKHIMRKFVIYTLNQIIMRVIISRKVGSIRRMGKCMLNLNWRNLNEGDHWE